MLVIFQVQVESNNDCGQKASSKWNWWALFRSKLNKVAPEVDQATGSVYQKQIGQPDLPTYESMQALCILHLYVSLIRRQINSLTLPFDYFNGSGETNLSK